MTGIEILPAWQAEYVGFIIVNYSLDHALTSSNITFGVAIFDSNPILSDALCQLLRAEMGVAAEIGHLSDDTELSLPDGRAADVIVIDPAAVGLTPTDIRRRAPHSALIAYLTITGQENGMDCARACIAAGFRGLVAKTSPTQVISSAILTTARGGIHIDADFGGLVLLGNGAAGQTSPDARNLSEREAFVLKSFARGMSMKEISGQLELSAKTIETYKARAIAKLNLQSRRDIVDYAIRNGWVQ